MSTRVLLVDDERDIVAPVSYALEQEGFEVRSAGDGLAALDLARAERYDVVVLDVVLPGLEICRVDTAAARAWLTNRTDRWQRPGAG